MYKSNQQLKQEAKQALAGKWGVAVFMFLFTFLFTYTFNAGDVRNPAYTITSLISSVLSIILNVGILSFFLKICCNQKQSASFADLFYGFQCRPGKAILLYLLQMLYLLPAIFIYAISIVILLFSMFGGMTLYADVDPAEAAKLFVILFILIALFIAYACYIQLTYGLVYYLLLDYPDLPVNQIWKRSAQLMKGNRWRKFKLELSFIPWAIACIFTLGIGFLWLGAYMNAAFTEFYLDLVSSRSLTHVCEATHDNHFEKTNKDYSGIDQETFK